MGLGSAGLQRFLVEVTKIGAGDFTLVAAVSGKKIRVRSMYGIVATTVAATYGTVKFASGPDIAVFIGTASGAQVLLDPAGGRAEANKVSEPLKITVDAGDFGTAGKAWIWGTYEVMG